MSELQDMPIVTVEQVTRFRQLALSEIDALREKCEEMERMRNNADLIMRKAQEMCGIYAGCDSPIEFAERIIELQRQLDEVTEKYEQNEASNKAVELVLDDVPYKGSYAEGVMFLKSKLSEYEVAAKQEPVAWAHLDVNRQDVCIAPVKNLLTKVKPFLVANYKVPLYALSPDLPALIAAAKQEMRERCINAARRVHGLTDWGEEAIRDLKD